MDGKNPDLLTDNDPLGGLIFTDGGSALGLRAKAGMCRRGRWLLVHQYGLEGNIGQGWQPPSRNSCGPAVLPLATPLFSRYTPFSKPAGPLPQGTLTSAGFCLRGGRV
jgi:hypothetical protein